MGCTDSKPAGDANNKNKTSQQPAPVKKVSGKTTANPAAEKPKTKSDIAGSSAKKVGTNNAPVAATTSVKTSKKDKEDPPKKEATESQKVSKKKSTSTPVETDKKVTVTQTPASNTVKSLKALVLVAKLNSMTEPERRVIGASVIQKQYRNYLRRKEVQEEQAWQVCSTSSNSSINISTIESHNIMSYHFI